MLRHETFQLAVEKLGLLPHRAARERNDGLLPGITGASGRTENLHDDLTQYSGAANGKRHDRSLNRYRQTIAELGADGP